jgi:hypothetical protein
MLVVLSVWLPRRAAGAKTSASAADGETDFGQHCIQAGYALAALSSPRKQRSWELVCAFTADPNTAARATEAQSAIIIFLNIGVSPV